jgi:hypothetical protein
MGEIVLLIQWVPMVDSRPARGKVGRGRITIDQDRALLCCLHGAATLHPRQQFCSVKPMPAHPRECMVRNNGQILIHPRLRPT